MKQHKKTACLLSRRDTTREREFGIQRHKMAINHSLVNDLKFRPHLFATLWQTSIRCRTQHIKRDKQELPNIHEHTYTKHRPVVL